MTTRLVITDVTRMQRGRVCIAGYDKEHHCIRPVLPPPGIPEGALEMGGQAIIFPFAMIELDLNDPRPQPPHTEDCDFAPFSIKFIQRITEWRKVLSWSSYETVAGIFEQPIQHDVGFYVKDCQGPRSLGTIQPKTVVKVIYGADDRGAWDYRIHFYDRAGEFYRLKIVDLTWHYYLDSLRGPECEPAAIAERLTGLLKHSQVFLRIGLARGWKEFPDRCYLQVTGIHTFPDYLDGKTFLDFKPHQVKEHSVGYELESELPY